MNYIREINAFYDLVQVKQLSTGQIALWHALMQINNKCAWTKWFTAPNLTLELTTGLSRKGIYNARNILKQHGIIDFKSNGQKATSYKLIPLLHITQGTTQGTTQLTTQGTTQVCATLNKLKETKLKDDDNAQAREEINIFKTWEQNIGVLSPIVIQKLQDWQNDMPDDVICKAIEVAVLNNARNWGYVNAILSNWHKHNIRTLDAVSAEEKNRLNKKNVAFKKGSSKKTSFNNAKDRDWDFDELQKLENERRERLNKELDVIMGGACHEQAYRQ